MNFKQQQKYSSKKVERYFSLKTPSGVLNRWSCAFETTEFEHGKVPDADVIQAAIKLTLIDKDDIRGGVTVEEINRSEYVRITRC